MLSENGGQEPPHTWRTSFILLRFLMVIMIIGVIFIEQDFARGFQKYIILRVFSGKWMSGTSTYLEDVLLSPEVPDNDLDGWGHHH